MTHSISNINKTTSFKLSDKVFSLLHSKGYSSIFNYTDFEYFKRKAKNAFNKTQAIAEMFIEENTTQSDFKEYLF